MSGFVYRHPERFPVDYGAVVLIFKKTVFSTRSGYSLFHPWCPGHVESAGTCLPEILV